MFTEAVRFLQKVAIFHPTDAKVLLLKRSTDDSFRPGDWDFPGGNVEWRELHKVALTREVFEETGLQLEHFTPLEVSSLFDAEENVYVLHIIYTCRSASATVTLSREHQVYGWFSRGDLEALPSSRYVTLGLGALKTLT